MRSLKALLSRSGAVLFGLDLLLLVFAWPVLLWMVAPRELLDPLLLAYPLAQLSLLYAMGLYRRDAILSTRRTLIRLPLVVGLAVLGAHVVQMVAGGAVDAANVSAAAMLGFAASAAIARVGLFMLLRGGVFRRRIMVVGAGRRAAELMAMVIQHGSDPHFDVVFVHEPALGMRDADLGRSAQQTVVVANDSNYLQLALAHDVDLIVVAPDERRGMRLERLLDCKKNGFPVVQHLEFVEHEARRVDLAWMELGWFLYSDGYQFGPLDRVLKRVLDLAVSVVILAFGSFLLVPAAIAIRLGDGGPVFYAQTRVTQGGRRFRILKLRTMGVDAERADGERGGRFGRRPGMPG